MAVTIQPDVRIDRFPTGEWRIEHVSLISFTCCGATACASMKAAPKLAKLLDRVHSCAAV